MAGGKPLKENEIEVKNGNSLGWNTIMCIFLIKGKRLIY